QTILEAALVRERQQQVAFRPEDARNLPNRALRLFKILKRLQRHDQIERLWSERQAIEVPADISSWVITGSPIERPRREIHPYIMMSSRNMPQQHPFATRGVEDSKRASPGERFDRAARPLIEMATSQFGDHHSKRMQPRTVRTLRVSNSIRFQPLPLRRCRILGLLRKELPDAVPRGKMAPTSGTAQLASKLFQLSGIIRTYQRCQIQVRQIHNRDSKLLNLS